MKKIITLLAVVGLVVFSACEGPQGPPGMPGQDGLDGLDGQNGQNGQDGLIAEVFELTMSFTSINGYGGTFPLDPKIYSGDNLLIYELVNVNDGIDTWALLPQVYYFPSGTAQYNYTFSFDQFSIFIDASFALSQLPANFTTDKTFRIVIIPGDDGINSGGPNSKLLVDKKEYSDYNAVIKKYGIDDSKVKVIQ